MYHSSIKILNNTFIAIFNFNIKIVNVINVSKFHSYFFMLIYTHISF